VRSLLRVARLLGYATLGLLAVLAATPLANGLARRLVIPDPPMPADAIVPLAATIHLDGTLSDDSVRRLMRAVELHGQGLAPLLVLSGITTETGMDEARTRASLVHRSGVSPSATITVSGHRTTREEALAVVAALRPLGARRLLIVTDWVHAERARRTFERAGVDVRVAVTRRPADTVRSPAGRLRLAWECGRELAALVYYRLAGFA
jgi:uncharacterized SAM-binding protein YcdF (DUF218 family)